MPFFMCLELPSDRIGIVRAMTERLIGVHVVAEGYSLANLVGKLEAQLPPQRFSCKGCGAAFLPLGSELRAAEVEAGTCIVCLWYAQTPPGEAVETGGGA